MHRDGRFFWPMIIYLRLSPRPAMGLELGSHPKPTQIADALVFMYVVGTWSPANPLKTLEV